jgi:hypothetical protein
MAYSATRTCRLCRDNISNNTGTLVQHMSDVHHLQIEGSVTSYYFTITECQMCSVSMDLIIRVGDSDSEGRGGDELYQCPKCKTVVAVQASY